MPGSVEKNWSKSNPLHWLSGGGVDRNGAIVAGECKSDDAGEYKGECKGNTSVAVSQRNLGAVTLLKLVIWTVAVRVS